MRWTRKSDVASPMPVVSTFTIQKTTVISGTFTTANRTAAQRAAVDRLSVVAVVGAGIWGRRLAVPRPRPMWYRRLIGRCLGAFRIGSAHRLPRLHLPCPDHR